MDSFYDDLTAMPEPTNEPAQKVRRFFDTLSDANLDAESLDRAAWLISGLKKLGLAAALLALFLLGWFGWTWVFRGAP